MTARFDPRREAYEARKAASRASAEQRCQGGVRHAAPSDSLEVVQWPAQCDERRVDAAGSGATDDGSCPPGGGFPSGGLPGRWRYIGTDLSCAKDGWCERPQRFREDFTGETYVRRCGSARSSRCEPCALLKRGDVASIGRSGWIDHPEDAGYMVTLTAPGADVLPWDLSKCSHTPGVACSGDIGCEVEADALARWHHGIGLRWSHWVTDMRRVLGPGVQLEFFKTWEEQNRGALHAHAMVRVSGVCSQRRFRAAVRLCTPRQGFGRQLRVDAVNLADSRAVALVAGYCASYTAKNADALPELETIRPDGTRAIGGVRAWSASRGWGETMGMVQARRCAHWALAAGGVAEPPPGDSPGRPEGPTLDLKSDIYALSPGDPLLDLLRDLVAM